MLAFYTPKSPISYPEISYKEFFHALQACHADNWYKRTGGCNNDKNRLNVRLRKVRLEASAQNRERAKERRKEIKNAWKELHRDD